MNVRAALLIGAAMTVLLLLTACGEGDSPDLLARRVEASFDVTAKVSYKVTLDPEWTWNPNPVSMTITQGRWGKRWDSYARDDKTFSGIFLDLGDEEYACFRYTSSGPGGLPKGEPGASENGGCYAGETRFEVDALVLARVLDLRPSYVEFLKETDELEWDVLPSRTIAGINADCYQFTMTDPTEMCFSGDDILLMVDVRGPDGSFTLFAIDVDRDVNEEDFALPYPVVDGP